jgi:hypothetical protein
MNALEILIAARAVIDTPEKLARGYYACAANGRPVRHDDDDAACWCLLGAIKRAGGYRTDAEIPQSIIALLHRAGVADRAREADWSDSRPHAVIIAAFDRAIELARAGL